MSMKSGDFLVGLAVGALIGVALGLVYAPQAGEETRGKVAERARKLKDAAAERGRMALRRGKEAEQAEEGEAE
jgi:gas vesicle protein